MWPQQQQQQQQQLADEQKQREYLKQQQKLRLMSANSRKQLVSADQLIENLLEQQDIFRPKAPAAAVPTNQIQGRTSANGLPQLPVQGYSNSFPLNLTESPQVGERKTEIRLPPWLSSSSLNLPVLYRQVWTFTGNDKGFVDTTKILPVLLTSGLSTDVLGYIWGLANRKVAGQLTEEELYIVLGLIALAQRGCAFNNISILNLIPQPPIPTLNLPSLHEVDPKSPTGVTSEEEVDEFTDFQSAAFETTGTTRHLTTETITESASLVDSSLLQSDSKPVSSEGCSLGATDGTANQKFPSVVVMSNTGRGIGSRLANHSLGTPRQPKARHHKHHHHHHHRAQQAAQPNVISALEDEFSDFQQARDTDNGGTCNTSDMFPKCFTKAVQGKTFVLKESAIRTEKDLDHFEPLSFTEADVGPSGHTALVDDPQIKKPGIEENKSSTAPKELISVEEDKYSALRALSIANTEKTSESNDDFGDFLSADFSTARVSGDDHHVLPPQAAAVWPSSDTAIFQSAEFEVEDWGSFESVQTPARTLWYTEAKPDSTLNKNVLDTSPWNVNLSVLQATKEIERWNLNESGATGNSEHFEADIEESVPNRGGLSLLGKIYDRSPGESNESSIGGNTLVAEDKDDDFGDFIGPETWATEMKDSDHQFGLGLKDVAFDSQSVSSLELPPLALSRHGSLPSLELKIFPQSGEKISGHQLWDSPSQGVEHQIQEWSRCLQSCMELLQEGLKTFSSITSDEILHEVVNAQKGRDYLYNLLVVYGICQRVRYSANQMTADSKPLETLFTAVDSTWTNLEHFYEEAHISTDQQFVSGPVMENQDCSSNTYENSVCGICLNSIGNDLSSNSSHLEYGGLTYHATCANLWVNCVECSLPSLTLL